jgi:uncharacterized peroxidase-related enzyme
MSRFSVKLLEWVPYIKPVNIEEATPRQLQAMKITPSNSKVSTYVRTLVHDAESYEARTKLYNTIMYSKGGLAQPDRELAALASSAINGCVYCASVHARRYIELTGSSEAVRTIYIEGLNGQYGARDKAIIDFASALAKTPCAATEKQVNALLEQGFSKYEIADLIHVVAIFGWANRLMHTLGHAVSSHSKREVQ